MTLVPIGKKLPSKAASKLHSRKTAELPPKPEAAELPQESPKLVLPPKAASFLVSFRSPPKPSKLSKVSARGFCCQECISAVSWVGFDHAMLMSVLRCSIVQSPVNVFALSGCLTNFSEPLTT